MPPLTIPGARDVSVLLLLFSFSLTCKLSKYLVGAYFLSGPSFCLTVYVVYFFGIINRVAEGSH